MMKKPFEQVMYDNKTICWGHGNNAVGPRLIASIRHKKMSKKEQDAEKKDWESAKIIYDKFINIGQRFKPSGPRANRNATAKITFIHNEKELITWKQDNLTDEQMKQGFIPAAGKFTISGMIRLYRSKEIEFI